MHFHMIKIIIATFFIILIVMVKCISASIIPQNDVLIEKKQSGTFPSVKSNIKRKNKEPESSPTTTSPDAIASTEPILPEWGGNCTKKHWDKCSHLERYVPSHNLGNKWVTSYLKDKKRPELGYKYHELDCKVQPILCLKNGWTVTRCQLLCMRCNREFISKYDKYVDKEGAC